MKTKSIRPAVKKQVDETRRLRFFVICKGCGARFGIEPKFILLYLKRIYALRGGTGKISTVLQDAQKVVEGV